MEKLLGKIFSVSECNEIISSLDGIEWVHRKQINTNPSGISFDYYLTDYNQNEFVNNKFKNLINSKFSFNVKQVSIYLLKYLPNQMFGRHIDRNEHLEKNKDFMYNINVVLNDDFDGGEFLLDDKKFEGNTPGVAYYYESTEWHEVRPVISGVRYSMLCYVRERDLIIKNKKSLI